MDQVVFVRLEDVEKIIIQRMASEFHCIDKMTSSDVVASAAAWNTARDIRNRIERLPVFISDSYIKCERGVSNEAK